MLTKKFAAIAMCCLFAVSASAQEATVDATSAATDSVAKSVKVMLNQDGTLEGKAFRTDTKEIASNVKVTLSADGKVVDAVETDQKGNFSFANVAPGAYQMIGSADGFVGSQSYDVVGFSNPSVGSPCSLGMCGASSDALYNNFSSAPVSSFSSSCGTCNSGGGFGGGRLGGRLGGGLLSNGRIGLIGLAGLAGLGGDDSSPDR